MTLQQNLKSYTEKNHSNIESQHLSQMGHAVTAGSRYLKMFYFAMNIAVMIMTKDRKLKTMLEKDPNTYHLITAAKDPATYELITYAWVIFLSGWGGVVSFINKVKKGESRACNFLELIGEVVTAGFAGVLTFWLCEAANINALITAAMVGISGHMGSRAIFMIEILITKKFKTGDKNDSSFNP